MCIFLRWPPPVVRLMFENKWFMNISLKSGNTKSMIACCLKDMFISLSIHIHIIFMYMTYECACACVYACHKFYYSIQVTSLILELVGWIPFCQCCSFCCYLWDAILLKLPSFRIYEAWVLLTHWNWEIWMKFYMSDFEINFGDWWLSYLSWTWCQMSVTGRHWW